MQNKAGLALSNQEMRFGFILALLLAGSNLLRAADFKGAAEVLRQVAQASPKPTEKSKDPYEPLREKLKAFQAHGANLPPAQAATQWLVLLDDFEKESGELSGSRRRGLSAGRPLQFDDVMKVLPPPTTWTELESAVEARSSAQAKGGEKRELGLRLIVHTLTKNTAKRTEDLLALDTLAKKGSGLGAGYEF